MNKVIINGEEDSRIDVLDRGFQYGDGLFETIAYKNHKLQFWDEHMQRLHDSCERLSLAAVDESLWLEDIKQCQLSSDAVIKLSLSRGVSGRGYAYADNDSVTRVTASFKLPDYPQANQKGITAVLCKTPVSVNPMLAGMKHLNRLDNVLARNEWHDSTIAEGFMFDSSGHIIQGTMSNVFCVLGDELYTPLLEQCGVAGIMREQVIALAGELNIPLSVVYISQTNFLQMDGVFVTNSLIGIWPVIEMHDIKFQQSGLIKRLQDELSKKMALMI